MSPKPPDDIFHFRPFAGLNKKLKNKIQPLTPDNQNKTKIELKAPDKKIDSLPDDEFIFKRAMSGVEPVETKALAQKNAIKKNRPLKKINSKSFQTNPDIFKIEVTGEHVRGFIKSLDKKKLKQLEKRNFSPEARLDLHNFTLDEAKTKVSRFIGKCHKLSCRNVLIIHGKGKGSLGNIPILKEEITSLLTSDWAESHVLAFSSARPVDGGTGAMYVFLKQNKFR